MLNCSYCFMIWVILSIIQITIILNNVSKKIYDQIGNLKLMIFRCLDQPISAWGGELTKNSCVNVHSPLHLHYVEEKWAPVGLNTTL